MSESTEKKTDPFSAWMEWQSNFVAEWMKQPMKAWQAALSMLTPQPGKNWAEDMFKAWTPPFPSAETEEGKGLGATVFNRLLDASKIYMDLLGFFTRAMAPLAQMEPGAELSPEKLSEMKDKWLEEYQAMMKSLWGAVPSKDVQETAEAVTQAQTTAFNYLWNFLEPVLKNLNNLPEAWQKAARGEPGAMVELAGLFRKNYEDTVGKALRAPSMGYFREFVELFNKTVDAWIQFNAALEEYAALFYATGQRAAEKVFQRLSEFQGKELTPETLREFYRLWWTINEDTYHELFLSPEFTNLLREVLRRGLLLRKWLDDLSDEIIGLTNLPTKKDMDEIYRTLYELKKEVRWHGRYIKEIEDHLGIKVKRPGPTAFTGRPVEDVEE